MKTIVFILITLTGTVFADTIAYSLQSSFHGNQEVPVKFLLRWTEEDGLIKGNYSDSRSVDSVKFMGLKATERRIIFVNFPNDAYGTKTLKLSTLPVTGAQTLSIPVSIEYEINGKNAKESVKATFHGRPK